MHQYYVLGAEAENHVSLGPKNPKLWDFLITKFDQAERFEQWTPFEVERITDHASHPELLIEYGDIIDFNLTPICLFAESVKTELGSLLEEYGELLPVFGDGAIFYLYHVTNELNALDESRSVLERFSDGQIMHVAKYAFKQDVIGDCDVFRLAERGSKWKVFVSDRFVQRVKSSGLKGFVFTPA